jgi:hypothetical protein
MKFFFVISIKIKVYEKIVTKVTDKFQKINHKKKKTSKNIKKSSKKSLTFNG